MLRYRRVESLWKGNEDSVNHKVKLEGRRQNREGSTRQLSRQLGPNVMRCCQVDLGLDSHHHNSHQQLRISPSKPPEYVREPERRKARAKGKVTFFKSRQTSCVICRSADPANPSLHQPLSRPSWTEYRALHPDLILRHFDASASERLPSQSSSQFPSMGDCQESQSATAEPLLLFRHTLTRSTLTSTRRSKIT